MDRSARVDRTALVVDDDVFLLAAMAELLSEEGYDVHTASNGFSALRVAIECQPSVILLDLALPERPGHEVLAELRAETATRDVAIVIVTGHPDRLSEAQTALTDGVVAKPFDIPDLLQTVRRAVLRAPGRRAEVVRISATSHRDAPVGARRPSGVHHTRPRL
jgi:CheY-like chemotaxis protein